MMHMSFGSGKRRWAAAWIVWLLLPLTLLAQQAGNVDPTFGASLGLAGNVERVLVQPDGKILVAGSFDKRLIRLNSDGSLDSDFDLGAGTNGFVNAMAVQADGKLIIGGYFTSVGGATRNGIARLYSNGSLDTGFDPGAGTDDMDVYTLALQSDGKVVIGGGFNTVGGITRHHIARLNADGSLDTGFDPGTRVGGSVVGALAVQSDGKVVIGVTSTTWAGFCATTSPGSTPTAAWMRVLTLAWD